MLAAVAQAAAVPLAEVRRAAMLRGAVGPVAEAALADGAAALAAFRLQVGRPVQPMLASTATDVEDALGRLGEAAVEWKLDGVRVQVHRSGSDVSVWTRSLDEITDRVPEVVEAALSLPVRELVLDGEAIALRPDGRPRPFQETGSRVSSRVDVAAARLSAPLSTYLFDVLHADGADVLDQPATDRAAVLQAAVPEPLRVPRVVTSDVPAAAEVLATAVARGHEGVVVKSLDAPYEAGRRGTGWLKVKPRHTLDLVVLAAEWGHGRRRGWLSNLHLGARAPDGGFVMLGKTFKGLTDTMLAWQTERLQELAVDQHRLGGAGAPGAGGRGRLRRRADLAALPRRDGPAVRPGAPPPAGQAARGGRHRRGGASDPPGCRPGTEGLGAGLPGGAGGAALHGPAGAVVQAEHRRPEGDQRDDDHRRDREHDQPVLHRGRAGITLRRHGPCAREQHASSPGLSSPRVGHRPAPILTDRQQPSHQPFGGPEARSVVPTARSSARRVVALSRRRALAWARRSAMRSSRRSISSGLSFPVMPLSVPGSARTDHGDRQISVKSAAAAASRVTQRRWLPCRLGPRPAGPGTPWSDARPRVLSVERPASRRGSPDGWSHADSRPRPATCQRPLSACPGAPVRAGSERPISPGYRVRAPPPCACLRGGRQDAWAGSEPASRMVMSVSHGHTHGPGRPPGDRRARAAEARLRVRVMWALAAVLVPVVAALVAGAIVLWPDSSTGDVSLSGITGDVAGTQFVTARTERVRRFSCQGVGSGPGEHGEVRTPHRARDLGTRPWHAGRGRRRPTRRTCRHQDRGRATARPLSGGGGQPPATRSSTSRGTGRSRS